MIYHSTNSSERVFAGTMTFTLVSLNITTFQLTVWSHGLHVTKRDIENTPVGNLYAGNHDARCVLIALRVQNRPDNKLAFIRKTIE
ncbi:hypothetical protein ACM18_24300 [Escherichia coli]|nr:hypothetical protein ACM18_24300 [Escherichia coli]